jgi:hypothetical protein
VAHGFRIDDLRRRFETWLTAVPCAVPRLVDRRSTRSASSAPIPTGSR